MRMPEALASGMVMVASSSVRAVDRLVLQIL
jgi:hypothetical protein